MLVMVPIDGLNRSDETAVAGIRSVESIVQVFTKPVEVLPVTVSVDYRPSAHDPDSSDNRRLACLIDGLQLHE